MLSNKTKIGLLVAGHIVAGLLLARENYNVTEIKALDEREFIGLFALVLAEAGLLGVWGGLGTTPPLLRFPAVEVATIFLCYLVVITTPFTEGKVLFASMTASLTMMILLVLISLRYGRRRLRLVHSIADTARPSTSRPFQYSIRHILIATLAVAVILGLGQFLRPPADDNMFLGFLCGPALLHCVLASAWATLDFRATLWRIVTVVILGFVFGLVPQCYFILLFHTLLEIVNGELPWWPDVLFYPTLFFTQSIIVLASLLVVRSCGWRLVRGTIGEDQPPSP